MDRLSLKLSRFALVGLGATMAYLALAWGLAGLAGFAPLAASVTAYAASAAFAYVAHRRITFRSTRAHSVAGPQFAATTLAGFSLTALITIACERAGLPYAVSVAAPCVAVPLFNFFVLDRLVFASGGRPQAGKIQ